MNGKLPKKRILMWTGLAVLIIVGFTIWFIAVCALLQSAAEHKQDTTENTADLEERRKQEALAYLEERYGEEFEITYYRGRGYAYDYVEMHAYPKGYSDEEHKFEIQGRYDENRNMVYTDTYVMVKLSDEYKACVDEIVDEYFDDYKLFLEFRSEWVFSNLPPDTKVEDLFELRANVDYPLPRTCLILNVSQKENMQKKHVLDMGSKLATWGYRGEFVLLYYSDSKYYEKKNNENKRTCEEGEERELHWMFIEDKNTILYDEERIENGIK